MERQYLGLTVAGLVGGGVVVLVVLLVVVLVVVVDVREAISCCSRRRSAAAITSALMLEAFERLSTEWPMRRGLGTESAPCDEGWWSISCKPRTLGIL